MLPRPNSALESIASESTGPRPRELKARNNTPARPYRDARFVGSLAAMGAVAPALVPRVSALEPQAAPGLLGVANMSDAILSEKIRRARLSGPSQVTANATVAEMDSQ